LTLITIPTLVLLTAPKPRVSDGNLVKLLVWCDNEWGFANRLLDTSFYLANLVQKNTQKCTDIIKLPEYAEISTTINDDTHGRRRII